jgi:hypothetical protein
MKAADERSVATGSTAIPRRTALLQLASIAVVIAVPIGAALSTAQPIADAPSRKELDIMPAARTEVEEQLRQETKRRRAAEKEAASDRSKRKSRDKGERPRTTEQRASTP